ncbi:hypothetical protein QKW60_09525 [Defluviimonas aestuarii]|uniref:hypothetical protein n=1 Tax=Albidovulum aestuarii TaxID=1130726 RepID=UPI00249A78D5|nr:hypothetical protein [Defluviimonas aestuarii]MDI3336646.1 hypothetical protein [Defluviimonas aestuarii]
MADEVATGSQPESYAAFELLAAIFSAREIDPAKLRAVFPVKAWREETVEVPVGLLRPIVLGWLNYIEPSNALSLGQSMQIEGDKQGVSPTRNLQATKDRDRRLAKQVVLDIVQTKLQGSTLSIDAACVSLAQREKVSLRVVERAYKKFGPYMRKKLQELGYAAD